MSAIQNESNEALSAELLETIKAAPAVNFERLVVNLLMKMGYGGNRANAGKVTQASGDNGIDGIINEDPLGLDTIYLQAKRWQEPVGEAPVRDFIGALDIKGVKKGVFLTTSHFTKPAWDAVTSIKSDKKVILIEGAVQRELADLSAAGLLYVTKQGNQKHYQANANAPVFAELRSLVLKSMGLADVLPAYAPDDKPLNASEIKALRKHAKADMPKGKSITKSSLFK